MQGILQYLLEQIRMTKHIETEEDHDLVWQLTGLRDLCKSADEHLNTKV